MSKSRKNKGNKKINGVLRILIIVLAVLAALYYYRNTPTASIDDIPAYSGQPYVVLNDNQPNFELEDLTTEEFELYSDLDSLGRCGIAYANISPETMPTEPRGEIGQVKPTGWHTVKYDCVDGKYLYNRCHLIGFQLAGENANEKNLITGTRYLNVEGMLPFENMVAEYVDETGNHVLYRITPIYEGSNLIAAGVHSKKTAVSEIILDEENARFVLTDGSVKETRRRDVVKLKVSASRIVIVLKNGEDYNIPKRRAGAVIRSGDEPLRGLKEEDFPFAEVKKALG